MESRQPESLHDVQTFYNEISPILESPTGMEARQIVADWNPALVTDLSREAEGLMLVHGQGVSDRYLYGFFAAFVAMRHENGDTLPELSPELYRAIRNAEDASLQHVDGGVEYFNALEDELYNRFPITATLIAHLERDLVARLGAPEAEVEEGFVRGWFKAAQVVMPLLRL